MSEEQPKKYNTNPLDKRVAERAEAEMDSVDTEAPTREMVLDTAPPPIAGGATQEVGRHTGPAPPAETAHTPPGAAPPMPLYGTPQTQGMYAPPQSDLPQPYAPQPYAPQPPPQPFQPGPLANGWDPLESTCRHASLSIL